MVFGRRLISGPTVAIAILFVLFAAVPFHASSMTRPEAHSLAQALNLNANDLRGFTASPIPPHLPQVGNCPGAVPRGRWLAFAHSDAFEQGAGSTFREVHSTAAVMPAAALADRSLDAMRGERGRQCFASAFKQALAGSRVKVLELSVTTRRAPVAAGVEQRIKLRTSGSGNVLTQYTDALVFVRHQVSIALMTTSVGPPFPTSLEDQLGRALVARAKQDVPNR